MENIKYVHRDTKTDAVTFLSRLDDLGFVWRNGMKPSSCTYFFNDRGEGITYCIDVASKKIIDFEEELKPHDYLTTSELLDLIESEENVSNEDSKDSGNRLTLSGLYDLMSSSTLQEVTFGVTFSNEKIESKDFNHEDDFTIRSSMFLDHIVRPEIAFAKVLAMEVTAADHVRVTVSVE